MWFPVEDSWDHQGGGGRLSALHKHKTIASGIGTAVLRASCAVIIHCVRKNYRVYPFYIRRLKEVVFSGRPSVRASVRPSVRPSVIHVVVLFPRCLQYLLTDFRQTFVTGASRDTDDLITFLGQKVKVQGHTIAAEAHSTRRYRRVNFF